MTRSQIKALNAAGDALRALGIGSVRLRYRPADELIPRERFQVWLDAGDHQRETVGCGQTPEAALFDALAIRDGKKEAE